MGVNDLKAGEFAEEPNATDGELTPMEVSRHISFVQDDFDWQYDETVAVKDMPSLQAEGVAGLYNRLMKYSFALAADEVGTGKTFVGLGVAAFILSRFPKSRVLVLTPRQSVANQWPGEFSTLVNHHFKGPWREYFSKIKVPVLDRLHSLGEKDDPDIAWRHDKKSFTGEASPKPLVEQRLVIAKFSSFSYLKSGVDTSYGKRIETIKEKLGLGTFDLVIIDESHYFRHSDSNRYEAASEIFSKLKPSCKFLFMTATPSHSGLDDVLKSLEVTGKLKGRTWLGTGEIDLTGESPTKRLLEMCAVRRYRRLSSKALTKHAYRQGRALPANFQSNPDSELFFCLYQKLIVSMIEKQKSLPAKQRQISIGLKGSLKRFLEGIEFDPKQFNVEHTERSDETDSSGTGLRVDYGKGFDNEILKGLIQAYGDAYGKGVDPSPRPTNPKYEKVIEDIWPTVWPDDPTRPSEKTLIFTRRIASTKELASQLVRKMDLALWQMILVELNEPLDTPIPTTRKEFSEDMAILLDDDPTKTLDPKEGSAPSSEDKVENESKLLGYFRKENLNKGEASTQGSRFKLLFDREGPFSQFFSPNPTEFGLAHLFDAPMGLDELGKANFFFGLKKALLHASTAVVELYCCFISSKPAKAYPVFFEEVKRRWEADQFRFKHEVLAYVEQYHVFTEKFLEESDKELAKDTKENEPNHFGWNFFNNASPAYPYTGSTKNPSVIKRFNAPFFPKVLVSTSVLQEGVNLHLNCSRVVHYGHAYTPGDDEQRIGRVDRMGGKIARELEVRNDARLEIVYPYLSKTHDESDLKVFLAKRGQVQKQIDNLAPVIDEHSRSEGEAMSLCIDDFLPKPEANNQDQDPYPATNQAINKLIC